MAHQDTRVALRSISSLSWKETGTIAFTGPHAREGATEAAHRQAYLHDLDTAQGVLRAARRHLERSSDMASVYRTDGGQVSSAPKSRTKVFLVHPSTPLRHEVARFIESGGLEAILLEERAAQGRTIIEQIEHHGDVDYAVVLVTGEDEGRRKAVPPDTAGELKPRARRNVILELGYFMGRLTRKHVAALYEPGVELPSDYGGVVYVSLADEWKTKLAREFAAAEFEVDLARMFGGGAR